MKKTLLFLLLLGIAAPSFSQQVFKTTPKSVIGFLEYLPPNYNSNSDKYPIVIFLHGLGERGPNSTDPSVVAGGSGLISKHGPPKHVKNGENFPFILISPQLKNNYGNWPAAYVMEVIDYVKTYLRIDERKIHITGLSLGGGGAWLMAQNYPQMFASVSPVCGASNSTAKACGLAAENLPVWAFHGDADPTVGVGKTITMVNAINACTPKPSPLAKMTIYPGMKHNAWDPAYAPDHSNHNPNIYEWMMQFTNTVNNGNKIPVANAGTDRWTTDKTYTLTASGTDADGTITSYAWTKMSGPACTMSSANTKSLALSGLNKGTYVFKVTVTDNAGDKDSDYVTLNVHSAPVANAGPDVAITLPANSVTLNGSGTDSDGTIASYAWSFVSGPATPTLANATSKSVTVSALNTPGTYTFQLQVKDNRGGTATDNVVVTVNNSPDRTGNTPPVANAGSDKTITLPTTSVSITGSGTDSDGTIASYKWTFVSGPVTPTLSGATSTKVTVNGLTKAGTYKLQLEVKDDVGETGTDEVIITVKAAANVAPVANAGSDKTITLPTTSVSLTGSGTDSDGTIASYKWIFVSGPVTPALSGATSAKVTVNGLTKAGTYKLKLEVKDNAGATGTDEVIITVKAAANVAPVANAGNDVTITQPTSSVSLTGSGSDSDGTIASYKWTFVSGPVTPSLSGATAAKVTVNGLTAAGKYTMQLEVKDNNGATGKDQVVITVKAATANIPPVAYAGKDVFIYVPESSATLIGTGTDPDGQVVSFSWKQISGPKATTISGANTNKITVSGLTVIGFYAFKLTVTDDRGATHEDKVAINVRDVSTTSASFAMENTLDEAYAVESVADLADDGNPYWNDKQVVVYNESGARLYAGKWSADSYQSVLRQPGMYIITIMNGGIVLETRKIMIVR